MELLGKQALKDKIRIITPSEEPSDDQLINNQLIYLGISDEYSSAYSGSDGSIITVCKEIMDKHFADKTSDLESFCSVRLHTGFSVERLNREQTMDMKDHGLRGPYREPEDASNGFPLKPNEFLLCKTLEKIWLPGDVCAVLQTRTSIASLGLDITPTNMIIPGFKGHPLTLHIHNRTNKEYLVPKYHHLAELIFFKVEATEGPYSGKAEELIRTDSILLPDIDTAAGGKKEDNRQSLIYIFLGALLIGLVLLTFYLTFAIFGKYAPQRDYFKFIVALLISILITIAISVFGSKAVREAISYTKDILGR